MAAYDSLPEFTADLPPRQEEALDAFNGLHDAEPDEDAPATSVIPAVAAETETFGAVTDEDGKS